MKKFRLALKKKSLIQFTLGTSRFVAVHLALSHGKKFTRWNPKKLNGIWVKKSLSGTALQAWMSFWPRSKKRNCHTPSTSSNTTSKVKKSSSTSSSIYSQICSISLPRRQNLCQRTSLRLKELRLCECSRRTFTIWGISARNRSRFRTFHKFSITVGGCSKRRSIKVTYSLAILRTRASSLTSASISSLCMELSCARRMFPNRTSWRKSWTTSTSLPTWPWTTRRLSRKVPSWPLSI